MEKMFSLLNEYIQNMDRYEEFDIKKCYINYTDSEKEKSNGIEFKLSEKSVPNEFFICYGWKNEIYFLVNDNDDYSNEYITKENANIVDLFLICNNGELQISNAMDKNEIFNELFIYEDNYSGHTYEDVVQFFKPFSLYKLDTNSVLTERHGCCIYAFYLLCRTREKNFPWKKETLDAIENVIFSESNKIPYYNIILTLNSRQWRHIFLESYKMIEHLFPVLFLKDVADKTGIDSLNLAKTFEEVLKWKPNEEDSIKKIFENVETNYKNEKVYQEILTLKTSKVGEMALYKWYYNEIRNQIAHFRIIHKNVEFSDGEWNTIIMFNFWLIEHLYNYFDEYIKDDNAK